MKGKELARPHAETNRREGSRLSGGLSDYERLIGPVEDRMIRTIWRIVRDPDDADDAMQQALETIWKRLARIRRHPNPHALILRICVNSAYGILRQKARHRRREALDAIPEYHPDPSPAADRKVANREAREEIFRTIGRLPRKQAEAVHLRFVEELPYREIAQALGCREATARKHVARGRVQLRRLLVHLAPYPHQEVSKS
jgi:RNA polymerase sigma factor (sigma-70 family)